MEEKRGLTEREEEMIRKMAEYMGRMSERQQRELLIFAEGAALVAQTMARESA